MLGWAEMLDEWPDVGLSFNVAPSSTIAAFYRSSSGRIQGQAMRWGLIPAWSKSFDSKYATFNARAETVEQKPSFRSAWKHQQRCLIPMAGYYEWQKDNTDNTKQPFYVSDPNVGGLVAAGLYETWQGREREDINYSCTMLTRPADRGLDSIHHRMPVLLTPNLASNWIGLSDGETGNSSLGANREGAESAGTDFIFSCEAPDIVYWPVGKAVGNVRNNDVGLIKASDLS